MAQELLENKDYELAVPDPHAMIESLRAVGYTLSTAIADIVDNSVAASAKNVWIDMHWSGVNTSVTITDDGRGMIEEELKLAMRPGTQSPLTQRNPRDLGRFGLGLKTASFSQCRSLTVLTKTRKTPPAVRRWDLDYVKDHAAWRLLKTAADGSARQLSRLDGLSTGTVVLWGKLDRVVDHAPSTDDAAHQRFLAAINAVRDHLAMTFHRYLAGEATGYSKPLQIYINGNNDSNLVKPWDPFLRGSSATQRSPKERIGEGASAIEVQSFVLPHKDRLTDSEYESGAGPLGWSAQQGFYIYRNDRILLAGDWLGLGRHRTWQKEEHCRLARISVDLGNNQDFDWGLDVKKSTARPPALFRPRLIGLGEAARKRSKDVFFHRAQVGPNPQGGHPAPVHRPWKSVKRGGANSYAIDRSHKLVAAVLSRLGPMKTDVEVMLRLIEETVPVERIWLDVAEEPGGYAVPYEGLADSEIWSDLRRAHEMLKKSGIPSTTAAAFLSSSEPFNRYPALIQKLKEL
jgi:hypothetical protein